LIWKIITCIWRYTLGLQFWSTYSSFHCKIYTELSKKRFYWIKGGQETTLSHAYYDTLHGPNQFFPKFLLNFKDWTYNFYSTLYMKLYAILMMKGCFHYWSGILGIQFASEWTHVCEKTNKACEKYTIKYKIAYNCILYIWYFSFCLPPLEPRT
jgi:hypothetical protein